MPFYYPYQIRRPASTRALLTCRLNRITFLLLRGDDEVGGHSFSWRTVRINEWDEIKIKIPTQGWNANGTLGSLHIIDPYNTGDNQSCTYSHDDLSRTTGVNCGAKWAQAFSFDPFGNIFKSGSSSFQALYSSPVRSGRSVGLCAPRPPWIHAPARGVSEIVPSEILPRVLPNQNYRSSTSAGKAGPSTFASLRPG